MVSAGSVALGSLAREGCVDQKCCLDPASMTQRLRKEKWPVSWAVIVGVTHNHINCECQQEAFYFVPIFAGFSAGHCVQ